MSCAGGVKCGCIDGYPCINPSKPITSYSDIAVARDLQIERLEQENAIMRITLQTLLKLGLSERMNNYINGALKLADKI